MTEHPIPDALASRPRDKRGYVIPFAAFVDPVTQEPDFRVIDQRRVLQCLSGRLCALCGRPLGDYLWFIGGTHSVRHGKFADPAMHEECALYALRACPHLARSKGKFAPKEDLAKAKDRPFLISSVVSDVKARQVALMKAKSCSWARAPDKTLVIRAAMPWEDKVRWFEDGEEVDEQVV